MTREPDRSQEHDGLEASLRRLGVEELEERLELSPLLAGGGVEPGDGCRCSCECDSLPPDTLPDNPPMPGPDGMSLF